MSIRCINCREAELEQRTVELTGEVRGESFKVSMSGLVCPKCGYKTIEGPAMPEFGRLLADQYRKAHGLLTSEEIRDRRVSLALNQVQFAMLLGVGVASVKRWELGKIQDRRSDELIRDKTRVTSIACFDHFAVTEQTYFQNNYAVGSATFVNAFVAIDPVVKTYINGVVAGCNRCDAGGTTFDFNVSLGETLSPYLAALFNDTLRGKSVHHGRN